MLSFRDTLRRSTQLMLPLQQTAMQAMMDQEADYRMGLRC